MSRDMKKVEKTFNAQECGLFSDHVFCDYAKFYYVTEIGIKSETRP